MTQGLHLDTHVVVWMYAGQHERFPARLRARINADALRFSPMVRLELTYLHELGRITDSPEQILGELASAAGLAEDRSPFSRVVDVARRVGFTRDPFDRLITAQAVAANGILATKDERILAAFPGQTVWG